MHDMTDMTDDTTDMIALTVMIDRIGLIALLSMHALCFCHCMCSCRPIYPSAFLQPFILLPSRLCARVRGCGAAHTGAAAIPGRPISVAAHSCPAGERVLTQYNFKQCECCRVLCIPVYPSIPGGQRMLIQTALSGAAGASWL